MHALAGAYVNRQTWVVAVSEQVPAWDSGHNVHVGARPSVYTRTCVDD